IVEVESLIETMDDWESYLELLGEDHPAGIAGRSKLDPFKYFLSFFDFKVLTVGDAVFYLEIHGDDCRFFSPEWMRKVIRIMDDRYGSQTITAGQCLQIAEEVKRELAVAV